MVTAASGCSGDKAPADAQPAAQPAKAAAVSGRRHDESSFAQPDQVRITDLALELALDFDRKQLAGTATYTLDWTDPKATQLVLDTRELTIQKVEGQADGAWAPLQFALADADPVFGSKLTIEAPQRNPQVRVTYHTAPTASGLQWLDPSMTEGKKLPFMFSQSQAIHARSWVPLQDTPSVRFTYTAHVTSRPDVMVLMSADNDPNAARDGDYTFKMPQPIPSYLMAIAAAEHSIDLQAAYFVPDELMLNALKAARHRKVRVRIILPGEHTDSDSVRLASKAQWGELLLAGVEIYEYQPTMMHNKLLIVDKVMTSVGSTNFDERSFRLNDEASLNIYDPAFAAHMTEVFEADLKPTVRYTFQSWQARPLKEKLFEKFVLPIKSQL